MPRNSAIELLSPVGSIESFHAAIDAGADAMYLGFGNFNARQRSKNFKPETLAYLIPHAQELGKKVYITMNTLVKDGEIPAFVEDCNILKQLKPDALIVQDLGMAALIKRYYSQIELHGSTQMAIHNSLGFQAAEKLGLKRVVPARELTLQEIRKINNKTNLEIELFVHGALCYSVSGNCLASSFIGGASGNRGKCTQVCRRKFSEGTKNGFYFSPKDFWAIDYIDEYRNIGISSLKIEGRMKGPEYTYSVTSAYREYLDGAIDIETAKERLSHDYGRQKSTFLLDGVESTGIVSAGRPAGTGNFAGNVMGLSPNQIVVDLKGEEVEVGDRVRFHSISGSEGEVAKVTSVKESEGMRQVGVSSTDGFETEGALFIISRPNSRLRQWKNTKVTVSPRPLKKGKGVPTGKAMAPLDAIKGKPAKNAELFIRVDSLEWLKIAQTRKEAKLILNVSKDMDMDLKKAHCLKSAGRLIVALPVLMPETELGYWKEVVESFRKMGVNKFMIAQYGIKEMFAPADILYADYPIWTLNRWTQKMLSENGFKSFVYSPEDDIMNLKRSGSRQGLLPVYMRVPLFLSRVKSPVQNGKKVLDDRQEGFLALNKNGLSNLISEKPLGLTHRISKMKSYGVNKFLVDFSWHEPDRSLFATVTRAYDKEMTIPGSILFNHKSGLQ